MIRCDVLLWQDVCTRGARMLRAMIDAAPSVGVECLVTTSAPTGAPLLMTWGMGHQGRRGYLDQHVAAGGRVISWDLGYWNRGSKDDLQQMFRVTIDHDHPWRLIKTEAPERFDAAGIALREDANPAGDILLASMGKKSDRLFPKWQPQTLERLAHAYPGKRVRVRAKAKDPIEAVLVGKSLVVCRHSNVAIDACIAGIPVECEDGAAFALYRHGWNPTREARLEFLRSVAWWQYRMSEAETAWLFLLRLMNGT